MSISLISPRAHSVFVWGALLSVVAVLFAGTPAQAVQILYDFEGDTIPTIIDKATDDGTQSATYSNAPGNAIVTAVPADVKFGANAGDQGNQAVNRLIMASSTNLGLNWTLAVHIKIDTTNDSPSNNKRIFSSYPAPGNQLAFQYDWAGAQNLHMLINGVGASYPTAAIVGNVYQHYAVTYNNGTVATYIDGVFVGGGTFLSGAVTLGGNIVFGQDVTGGGSSEQVVGAYDDVLVWDQTLTLAQIQYLSANSASSASFLFGAPALTTSPANGQTLSFGNVRVGTSGTANITVTNTGTADGLTGTFPGAIGEFSPAGTLAFGPLNQTVSDSRTYSYTPSGLGADSQAVTVLSNDVNSTITLAGTGVGPVYSSVDAPGSLLDFGPVSNGGSANYVLTITNTTGSPDDGTLDNLSLLASSFIFSDSQFSVLSISDMDLSAGESAIVTLQFTGDGNPGISLATLTVHTDVGVAYLQDTSPNDGILDGATFTYNLTAQEAIVVPEPASLALLGMAGLSLLARRRTRA